MQIVVLDAKTLKVEELDLSPWRSLGTLSLYDRTDPILVPQRLRGADVVLTNKARLTVDALRGASSLRMIGVLATGYDVVDVKAARALGIPVCNVPGYATGAVTESVFGFLLEMTRRTYQSTARIRQGAWTACPEFCWWDKAPLALEGRTMGVVGCGAIGSRVAAVGRAFGMRVLGYARHERPDFPGTQVPLEKLLAASDVVTLHCPAAAENLGFINAETIEKMKDGALLINTARGSLVNEADVAAALASGKLGGYGADVASREPIDIHNPLLKAPNCYLTAHSAWATVEARQKIVDVTAESIRGMLAGSPVNVVN
jgi:glycerate dehydrogenase